MKNSSGGLPCYSFAAHLAVPYKEGSQFVCCYFYPTLNDIRIFIILRLQSLLLQNTAASSQLSAAAAAVATPLTGLGSKLAGTLGEGGGVTEEKVYLSQEQTVQLHTQIQQV